MHSFWADVYNSSFSSETKVSVSTVRHNVSICFVTWVQQCCSSGDLTMLPFFFFTHLFVSQKIFCAVVADFFFCIYFFKFYFDGLLNVAWFQHNPSFSTS